MKKSLKQALLELKNPERAIQSTRFFKTGKGEYGEGDIIVQLSDGLPEAPNLVGEMYDYERLGQLIEINGSKSAQGMIDSLIASVDSWLQGKHNPDDITLVVIKKK